MYQQLQALQQTCAQLAQRVAATTGEDPSGLLAAIGMQGQQGQPRQAVRSGSSGGTSAQAYERAASLAQGAEQRRLERSSPV